MFSNVCLENKALKNSSLASAENRQLFFFSLERNENILESALLFLTSYTFTFSIFMALCILLV